MFIGIHMYMINNMILTVSLTLTFHSISSFLERDNVICQVSNPVHHSYVELTLKHASCIVSAILEVR